MSFGDEMDAVEVSLLLILLLFLEQRYTIALMRHLDD